MKALLCWLCAAAATAPVAAFLPVSPYRPFALKAFGTRSLRLAPSSMAVSVDDPFSDEAPGAAAIAGPPPSVQIPSPTSTDGFVNMGLFAGTGLLLVSYLASMNMGIWHGWTWEEVVTRIPMDVWLQYTGTLAENPIATKACTSATVYTLGDIIAQRTEGTGVAELDRSRIVRSLAAGLIGHGPLSHVWYQVCDGLFDNILMWTAWWVFLPKVLVDQVLWGPFWNNTYILMLGAMKGQDIREIWEDVKRTTVPLIVSGLKLWPAAHLVTYGLIPVEHRLLWVDLVEILWVTILATQASGPRAEPSLLEEQEQKPATA